MKPSPVAAATRGRFRLTSEGLVWLAAAVALGMLGWLKSLNLVLLLAYLMLALLVLNGFLARRQVLRIRAKRVPLAPAFANEVVRTVVELQNTGTSPATLMLEEGTVQWNVMRVPGTSTVECAEFRRLGPRGRRPAPPITLASAFPFGLLRFDRIVNSSEEWIVLPALGQADAEGMRRWILRQSGADGQPRRSRRATIDLADIRGVRPYRPGDSFRSIHWRSSARRCELMVREYDAAPSANLLLVVEPWLPANPSAKDFEQVEAALSLTATIVQVWWQGKRERLISLADAVGGSEFTTTVPSEAGPKLKRSARVVVSTRPKLEVAATLARVTGKPFLVIDPAQELPWYQPPTNPESPRER